MQCADGFGGGYEPAFEPGEVVADQGGAFVDVGGEQAGDVADRHVEVAESPDDLGGRYLVSGVVAVARVRVDLVGREQLGLVIVPQRLHAQVRHGGELADAQQRGHIDERAPSRKGRVPGEWC